MDEDDIGSVLFIGDNLQLDIAVPLELGMKAMHYSKESENRYNVRVISHWDAFRPDNLPE